MSTAGDTDSVFSDGDTALSGNSTRRKKRERQTSIAEIVSSYEKKQRKSVGKSPKAKSPKAKSPPGKGGISAEMLDFIKEIIESTIQTALNDMNESISRLTNTLEKKLKPQRERASKFSKGSFSRNPTKWTGSSSSWKRTNGLCQPFAARLRTWRGTREASISFSRAGNLAPAGRKKM